MLLALCYYFTLTSSDEDGVTKYHYVIYGSNLCPECVRFRGELEKLAVDFEYRPLEKENYMREFLEIMRILSMLTGRNETIRIPFVVAMMQDRSHIAFLATVTNINDLKNMIRIYEEQKKPIFRNIQGDLLVVKEDIERILFNVVVEGVSEEKGEIAYRVEVNIGFLIMLALSDSVNPCTFLIYITLLMLLSLKYNSVRRVIRVGLSFIMGILVGYVCLGIALFRITMFIPKAIIVVLGITLGVYSIVTGIMRKPKIIAPRKSYDLLYKVTTTISAFGIGLLISLSLLPCSAGPYIIAIKMLSEINVIEALPYIIVYNFIFVLPLIFVLTMTCMGLKIDMVREVLAKKYKHLSVVAGILLIILSTLFIL